MHSITNANQIPFKFYFPLTTNFHDFEHKRDLKVIHSIYPGSESSDRSSIMQTQTRSVCKIITIYKPTSVPINQFSSHIDVDTA